MHLRENIPLAPLTTLGVGGAARYFAEAATEAEVVEAVAFARSRSLPLFVLGGGSNVVVADRGFDGLVLKIANAEIAQDGATFTAAAGCDWDGFVAKTIAENCAGLECLSGIPGTVGGTPAQNVGAYGQEVSETITEVRALDLSSMNTVTLTNAQCGFAYRSSLFNSSERGRYVILQVSFALRPGGEPALRYPELQKHFARQAESDIVGGQDCGARDPAQQSHADRSRRRRGAQRRVVLQESGSDASRLRSALE